MIAVHYYTPANEEEIKYVPEKILQICKACIKWKKTAGAVKLYTNKYFYDILNEYKLTSLWSDIDYTLLSNIPNGINPDEFPVIRKLMIYEDLLDSTPFVYFDSSLVFKKPFKNNKLKDCIVYHFEENIYPWNPHPVALYSKKIDDLWNTDWIALAANTTICFINSRNLLDDYLFYAKIFYHEKTHTKLLEYEVDFDNIRSRFVENRLFSEVCRKMSYSIDSIILDNKHITIDGKFRYENFNLNYKGESNVEEIMEKLIEENHPNYNLEDLNSYLKSTHDDIEFILSNSKQTKIKQLMKKFILNKFGIENFYQHQLN